MLVLHLGVIDQPYRAEDGRVGATTTGDVAEYLEAEYGVMRAFVRWDAGNIQEELAKSVRRALEALVMGGRVDPFRSGLGKIESSFRFFINSKTAELVGIPNTPTKAALRGVNHRLKHPYGTGNSKIGPRPNPRRPSFRDTGLYVASFRAWMD